MAILRTLLALLRGLFASHAALVAENLALRQQLIVLQRSAKRPQLGKSVGVSGDYRAMFSAASAARLASSALSNAKSIRRMPQLSLRWFVWRRSPTAEMRPWQRAQVL